MVDDGGGWDRMEGVFLPFLPLIGTIQQRTWKQMKQAKWKKNDFWALESSPNFLMRTAGFGRSTKDSWRKADEFTCLVLPFVFPPLAKGI